ncbi:hypothetical protein BCR33DRAFT_187779 [Rhizoclosmatium globosum]|uniref:Uncharacterized protein n=1 Tax=Rhizoclosmatium globosum TaxID=329046 RepID=A0A1Y2D1F3_9FUNG|nr:hypothetical protein BCR33DRAFT_187779 [Rhizoclosmatium globosum]|eukprot:ORY53121.1 hypothetical protein BCR33DRAFT_187779 [Rhizoclosmatium globosum]
MFENSPTSSFFCISSTCFTISSRFATTSFNSANTAFNLTTSSLFSKSTPPPLAPAKSTSPNITRTIASSSPKTQIRS